MTKKCLWLAILVSYAVCVHAGRLLENKTLRVEIDEKSGALAVVDLRSGYCWKQICFAGENRQRVVAVDPQKSTVTLACLMELRPVAPEKAKSSEFLIVLKLGKAAHEVCATFQPLQKEIKGDSAEYPYTFVRDGERVFNLYPHAEGVLVPVRREHPDWMALPGGALYGGVRSYLMCLGLVDLASGQGMLTLLPSFESTHLRWRDWHVPEAGKITVPQLVWSANKKRFDRPFEVLWTFSHQGGYVSLAQQYRLFFAERGYRKTLAEKAKENREVQAITGAPIFWAVAAATPRQVLEMATVLRTNGVEKCLFALPVIYAPQALWSNAQERVDAALAVRKMGYTTYRYDQYRDTFKLEPGANVYLQVNTEAFPEWVVRNAQQKMIQAFGPKSGVICPDFFMQMAKKYLPPEFSTYDYPAWFLDCLGSVEFNAESECFDPNHPCDRFDSRKERENLLRYVNEQKRIAGTECGLDYLIPYVHWFEGATTLVNWVEAFDTEASETPASINASEVMTLGKSVTQRVAAFKPNEKAPLTKSLSTRYRIPFYSLCHHDEVIVTWRWEDGMNKQPVYWQYKNLWSVLYGAPPMYRPSLSTLRTYQKEIGQTDRYVSSWVRAIAFDAMVSHRFVTLDKFVQETEFSSGKGVIVNFGDKDFVTQEGQAVPSMDYRIFTTGPQRVYTMPPCKNVFK